MNFLGLLAWQEARILVKMIYKLTRKKELAFDYKLVSQLNSSAVSIMTNIAEGFERHSIKEKIQFYNISRASCGEVRSLLYVLLDSYTSLKDDTIECNTHLQKVGKLVTGLMQATQKRLT